MRFKDIINAEIKESAITQYMKQLGATDRRYVLNCYVAMLDYSNTVEGFEYWNKVRNLKRLSSVMKKDGDSVNKSRIHFADEGRYQIDTIISKLLKEKNIAPSTLSSNSGYYAGAVHKVLGGSIVGEAFIETIAKNLEVDPQVIFDNAKVSEFTPRKTHKKDYPKGTMRICNTCNVEKDLDTCFPDHIFTPLGKGKMCKNCKNTRRRKQRKAAKSSAN